MLSADDVELAEALRLYLTSRYPLEDADAVMIRFGRERGGALLVRVHEIPPGLQRQARVAATIAEP